MIDRTCGTENSVLHISLQRETNVSKIKTLIKIEFCIPVYFERIYNYLRPRQYSSQGMSHNTRQLVFTVPSNGFFVCFDEIANFPVVMICNWDITSQLLKCFHFAPVYSVSTIFCSCFIEQSPYFNLINSLLYDV